MSGLPPPVRDAPVGSISRARAQYENLLSHVALRPYDIDGLIRCCFLSYELKEFNECMKFTRRILVLADMEDSQTHASKHTTASQIDIEFVHLKLAKCLMRRWTKYGEYPDLKEALSSYKVAMRNKDILRRYDIYFEVSGAMLKINNMQGSLDTLGAFVGVAQTGRKYVNTESALMLQIAQYNVAQLMFVKGDVDAAHRIYTELALCDDIDDIGDEDTVHVLTSSLKKFNISLEIARILYRKGKKDLAKKMFEECWVKFKRHYLNPKIYRKPVEFDLCMGYTDFNEWYHDPTTWMKIGRRFRKLRNYVFGGEFYGHCAEMLSLYGFEKLGQKGQKMLVDVVLARGECMYAVCMYDEAEYCAHVAYDMSPTDAVVIARSSRILSNREDEINRQIIEKSVIILYRFQQLHFMLHMNAYRGRVRHMKERGKDATKICSYLRMMLVKNRMAEFRLAHVSACNNLKLIKSLGYLWKKGRESVENWLQIWNLNAEIAQRSFVTWYRRTKFRKFFRGMSSFQNILRGQTVRRRCRRFIEEIQTEIDATPDPSLRVAIDMRHMPLAIDACNVDVISSGSRSYSDCPSAMNFETEDKLSLTYGKDIPKYSSSTTPSRGSKINTSQNNNKSDSHVANRNTPLSASAASYVKSPSTTSSATSVGVEKSSIGLDNIAYTESSSSIIEADNNTNTMAPPRSIYSLEMFLATDRGKNEDVISVIGCPSLKSNTRIKWVPFGILADEGISRLLMCSSLIISSHSFSLTDCLRLIEVVQQSKNRLWKNIRHLSVFGTQMGPDGMKGLLQLGVSNLNTLTITNVGITHHFGDIIGSYLENENIMNANVATTGELHEDREDNLWPSSASSSVIPPYPPSDVGSLQGSEGVEVLDHENDVTSSDRGSTMLSGSKYIENIGSKNMSMLTKLHIDSEAKFGDRGCKKLCDHLLLCASLKTLSLTYCGLTARAMKSLCAVCMKSKTLKTLKFTGNKFKKQDCINLIVIIANKGSRGSVATINLQSQSPPLSAKDELYIMKWISDKDVPMKVYGSAVPEDVMYKRKIDLKDEMIKFEKSINFDDTENLRIKRVIENTPYHDAENFQSIVSGSNCFTKTLFL